MATAGGSTLSSLYSAHHLHSGVRCAEFVPVRSACQHRRGHSGARRQGESFCRFSRSPICCCHERQGSQLRCRRRAFPTPRFRAEAPESYCQVTISFREFGIQSEIHSHDHPARGTIGLHVAPEVSSLDFANALSVAGMGTVPALNTRKVETDVELQDGQSLGIAGLLNES